MAPGEAAAGGNFIDTANVYTGGTSESIIGRALRGRRDRFVLATKFARDNLTPLPEPMRALDDQVRAGKLLHVAVSDWPAWEIARANTMAELRDWSPFVGVQLRYNLLSRSPEAELLPMARELDLAVVAWGPLAEGRLTGKYLRGEQGRLNRGG
ncbi:hypothetical protein GCM10010435_25740 [Winogradskya consettensis]|uniref:NADP-dependent oxidoreductase domain-containing protein n=1 Tax=Winogradskya consettensis TaxID=113560 RepID=A0A919S8V3_9ACTN|nr:aldo/keto reductase [Actinoplanes consettensis]GIM67948.1 hypothetical protein Aco04nite_08530 [Actinoplanes consettensis]